MLREVVLATAVLYGGNAVACDCTYPAFTTCTTKSIPAAPYAKMHGREGAAFKTYAFRVNPDEKAVRQISFIPGQNGLEDIAAGVEGTVDWKAIDLVLMIDEGADGKVDATYKIHMNIFKAGWFKLVGIPDILAGVRQQPAEKKKEYLHERLRAYGAQEVTGQQERFDDLVVDAQTRMQCTQSAEK